MWRRYKQFTLSRRQVISRAMRERNITNKFLECGEIAQLLQVWELFFRELILDTSDIEGNFWWLIIGKKVNGLRCLNDFCFEAMDEALREIRECNRLNGLNGLKVVLNQCDYAYYESLLFMILA